MNAALVAGKLLLLLNMLLWVSLESCIDYSLPDAGTAAAAALVADQVLVLLLDMLLAHSWKQPPGPAAPFSSCCWHLRRGYHTTTVDCRMPCSSCYYSRSCWSDLLNES